MDAGTITKVNEGKRYWRISSAGNHDISVPVDSGYLLMSTGWEHISNISVGDKLWNVYTQGFDISDVPEFKKVE